MAEKRMFAKSIVLTDAFLDMPMSARCLYFTLGMLADDDGFVGSPKSIMRQCGASQDDLMVLLSKRFVLGFDSGVIVIKHWRINNYLQANRHRPTTYQEELATLMLDEKGSYTESGKAMCLTNAEQVLNRCSENVDTDKNSIDKTRLEEKSKEEKSIAHACGEYGWVKLTDEQYTKLEQDLGEEELLRCIRYVDESAQQTGNKNKWKDWNLVIRKCNRDGWGKTNTQTAPAQPKGRNIKASCNNYPTIDLDRLYSAIDKI